MTAKIEQHIDIRVPARDAYSQWTQFQKMPDFVEHVTETVQIDDRHLRLKVKVAGITRELAIEITEQIPDKRIAWTGTGDTRNAGCVTFHRLSDEECRVMFQMELQARDILEKVAEVFRIVDHQVVVGLRSFKEFVESRDAPTGRWEGSVPSLDEASSEK